MEFEEKRARQRLHFRQILVRNQHQKKYLETLRSSAAFQGVKFIQVPGNNLNMLSRGTCGAQRMGVKTPVLTALHDVYKVQHAKSTLEPLICQNCSLDLHAQALHCRRSHAENSARTEYYPPCVRSKSQFFNTENRPKIIEHTGARKYAILSAHNYSFQYKRIRIYSEITAYRCIKHAAGAKSGAIPVKNPRLPEKTPPKPNILGLRGVFRRCLKVTGMRRKSAKNHRFSL